MDINSFKNILAHFPENSSEEVHEVLSLKKQFPYSQVLHALAAKLSREHNLATQNRELELAAVYATDRSVLKEVMDTTSKSTYEAFNEEIKNETSVAHKYQVETFTAPTIHYSTDTNLADEVLRDLERLNELRHNFEAMYVNVDPPKGSSANDVSDTPTEPKRKRSTTKKKTESEDKTEPSGPTKKERIVALAKEGDEPAQPEKKKETTRKKKSSSDPAEGLINEIASSKEALNPESEKQKEQIEIIDQFINAQPSLINVNKDRTNPASLSDLAALKSGEFGDNVVSETLVDILIRQGKKDKAIEVLKKLIWKFPQKKAYFAAQIEELKK